MLGKRLSTTARVITESLAPKPERFTIKCRSCRGRTDIVIGAGGINDAKPGAIEFYCLDCGQSEALMQS